MAKKREEGLTPMNAEAKTAKVMRLIGLARKANALAFGTEACEKIIRRGGVALLFLAKDAGRSTQSLFVRLAEDYGLPLTQDFVKAELSEAVGRERVAVLALVDVNFAKEICRLLEIA